MGRIADEIDLPPPPLRVQQPIVPTVPASSTPVAPAPLVDIADEIVGSSPQTSKASEDAPVASGSSGVTPDSYATSRNETSSASESCLASGLGRILVDSSST